MSVAHDLAKNALCFLAGVGMTVMYYRVRGYRLKR